MKRGGQMAFIPREQKVNFKEKKQADATGETHSKTAKGQKSN